MKNVKDDRSLDEPGNSSTPSSEASDSDAKMSTSPTSVAGVPRPTTSKLTSPEEYLKKLSSFNSSVEDSGLALLSRSATRHHTPVSVLDGRLPGGVSLEPKVSKTVVVTSGTHRTVWCSPPSIPLECSASLRQGAIYWEWISVEVDAGLLVIYPVMRSRYPSVSRPKPKWRRFFTLDWWRGTLRRSGT